MAFKTSYLGIFFATLSEERAVRWEAKLQRRRAWRWRRASWRVCLANRWTNARENKRSRTFWNWFKHPVMYDFYNLCEMAFVNRLSFFKVKTIREMCKQFEIPSNLRDTKSSLVKKLSQMVECSCMKESNYAMNVSNNYFGKLKFHNFVHGDIRDGSGLFGLWIMRSRPNGRNCRMKWEKYEELKRFTFIRAFWNARTDTGYWIKYVLLLWYGGLGLPKVM